MSPSPSILIIGASRGLGLALTQYYSSQPNTTIYATVRSPPKAGTFPDGVKVIEGIDVSEEEAGKMIVEGLKGGKVGVVIVVAGVLKPEVSVISSYRSRDGAADERAEEGTPPQRERTRQGRGKEPVIILDDIGSTGCPRITSGIPSIALR